MMLVDLTMPVQAQQRGVPTYRQAELPIGDGPDAYTALTYRFSHDSMVGTYLDLPGHIEQTDDGMDAASWPADRLYRIEASVVHLDREDGSGPIGADELAAACPTPSGSPCLVINALGTRQWDDIEERSVYLAPDAVQWIIDRGTRLLVSDVYESAPPRTVFLELFRCGIATVCYPIDLHRLTSPAAILTALPARFPGVTQLPCRLLAEVPGVLSNPGSLDGKTP